MLNSQFLTSLIFKHFGKDIVTKHFKSIFGYGSGVVFQSTQKAQNTEKTIDFLIEVPSMRSFHLDHYAQNRGDYEQLGYYLGPKFYEVIEAIFPVHFGHCIVENRRVKYGVIATQDLHNDLGSWELMSMAGRLHKPVVTLKISQQTESLLQENRRLAVNIALMELHDRGTLPLHTFYETISDLSYRHDIRRKLKIDMNKSSSIVRHSSQQFNRIYQPTLLNLCATLPNCLTATEQSLTITPSLELSEYLLSRNNVPFGMWNSMVEHFLGQQEKEKRKKERKTRNSQIRQMIFSPKKADTPIEEFKEEIAKKCQFHEEQADIATSIGKLQISLEQARSHEQAYLKSRVKISSSRMLLYNLYSLSPKRQVQYVLQKIRKIK